VVHVISELFNGQLAVALAFDGQTPAISFNNEIDATRTDLPLRNDVVAGFDQMLHDIALECRLNRVPLVLQSPGEEFRRLGVLNEPASQVTRL
jgi:hypothetical protein